jgi:hypothetical protein
VVEREEKILRAALRGFFLKLRQSMITLEECLRFGSVACAEAYVNAKTAVVNRFASYGLVYDADVDVGSFVGFAGVLAVWRRICEDYIHSKSEGTLMLAVRRPKTDGQLGGWANLDTATAAFGAYWLTQRGLLRRVDMAASDLTYGTANLAMLDAAVTLDASKIEWITEDDELVCTICEGYGNGGEKQDGTYKLDDPTLPEPPPVHPNCRCRYKVYFN